MSVELYPVLSTESQLREKLGEGDFLDLVFEEKSIAFEELPHQGEIGADLTSCYEQFSSKLPETTRAAFDEFADVVCWGYRDGPQPLDSTFQPEGIHFSCSPETCSRLASSIATIDHAAVRREFIPDMSELDADFFLNYLEAWRDIFKRASDNNQFVFAFIP